MFTKAGFPDTLFTGSVLLVIALLIFLWIDPIIPPSASQLTVLANEKEIEDLEQPTSVIIGKPVRIEIQVYFENINKPLDAGEFTYQWCFEPPVDNNLLCSVNNYKGYVNTDYIPKNSEQQQNLEIIVQHKFLKTSTVTVSFQPVQP